MGEDVDSLVRRIVLNEIAGKNQAIQAYDKMIWTVRTGFLTLLFAGWGLLLSSVANGLAGGKGADLLARAWLVIVAMATVSIGLSIAGFIVDLNYVRCKFRVISALNGLTTVIVEHNELELTRHELAAKHLLPFLSVSGHSGTCDYACVSGYEGERKVSVIIYSVPLIAVSMAITIIARVS
jgi:hypothetical protein